MERIIKSLIILLILACTNVSVYAYTQTTNQLQTINASFRTNFSECTKTFPIGIEKLFYLTLAGANQNNYQIKEIQTKSGYIIFETGYRKFLASIIYVSSSKSMLKITPYSGNYDFPPAVVQNLFNYIENNQSTNF